MKGLALNTIQEEGGGEKILPSEGTSSNRVVR